MFRRLILVRAVLPVLLFAALAQSFSTPSARAEGQSAALTTPRALALPGVLGASDIALYRRIFALQEKGNWKAADRLIKQLEDDILMGHVMAQRYLHPTKWRSTYKQLKAYMSAYADHPDAQRLYKLALKRRPKNWKYPVKPHVLPARAAYEVESSDRAPQGKRALPRKRLNKAEYREARQIKRRVHRALRRGYTLVAKRTIEAPRTRKLLSSAELSQLKGALGLRYFFHGRTDWAIDWAGRAVAKHGDVLPDAHWALGLAYWRKENWVQAAKHFKSAADAGFTDPWLDAGASFWAARALMITRQPAEVNQYLEKAASHARTFYGLMAARILGKPIEYRWQSAEITQDAVEALQNRPRGQRALALMEVGQVKRAERELRNLSRFADRGQVKSLLAMAELSGMASLAVRLHDQVFPDGGGYDGAAYPIPRYEPATGFEVDRALVYALIRQESNFNPRAKSWAGARGLMQLMPGTASFVAKDRRLRQYEGRKRLYDPTLNLTLGQEYIQMLLEEPHIQGDLMRMMMAWNAGPGNLRKWKRSTDYAKDPLFFIESIPARETRQFVERVFANLWIYRDRLNQEKPSLDALAAGEWPRYVPLGQGRVELALIDAR